MKKISLAGVSFHRLGLLSPRSWCDSKAMMPDFLTEKQHAAESVLGDIAV